MLRIIWIRDGSGRLQAAWKSGENDGGNVILPRPPICIGRGDVIVRRLNRRDLEHSDSSVHDMAYAGR